MGEAEISRDSVLLGVEGELGADGLVGVGGVVQVEEEGSNLDVLGSLSITLLSRNQSELMLESNKYVGSWSP